MTARKWTHIIIHHTGAEEKDAAQVRRYHLSLGWIDTGYHYVIERAGRVVPGRGLTFAGAHCLASGMNSRGIGIALIGNLENHPALPPQESSLLKLVRDLSGRFSIPVGNVLGHKEVPGAATACPGKHLSMASLRNSLKVKSEKIHRVQVGAYRIRENAEDMANRLRKAGFPVVIIEGTLDS